MIIPTFKKNDPLLCNNYRPISLLSNIGKLIEKLIYKRLYAFLEQNECLYTNQFGFRNLHSTNHALVNITEKRRNGLDNNMYAEYFLTFRRHLIQSIIRYYYQNFNIMASEELH